MALDFPTPSSVGQVFTAAGTSWTWDGVKWKGSTTSTGGGGGAGVTVSDTAPALTNGALWFRGTDTQLYVGYADANSSQWVASANPSPGDGSMYGVTKTDRSGAITLNNTAQTLMVANTARRGWSLQNKSTGNMWFQDLGGTASTTGNNSTYLPPGAYYESEFDGASVAAISVISDTTGAQFVAKEW